jgi:PsbN protein
MMDSAFFFPLFLWSFLLSITIYSIYIGFGPPSENLRDPFKEHEDLFSVTQINFFLWHFRKNQQRQDKVV